MKNDNNKKGYHFITRIYGDDVLVIKTGNTVMIKNLVDNGNKLVVGKRDYDFGIAKCNVSAGDVFNLQFGKKLAYERMKRKQLRKEVRDDKKRLETLEHEIGYMTNYGVRKIKRLSDRIHMI